MSVARTARFAVEERTWVAAQSAFDGSSSVKHPAGNPLRLDVFLLTGGNPITDVSITAVSASILAKDFTGDSFADAVSASFDVTVNTTTWQAGTAQSATINFTGAQLELPIADGQESQDYVIVLYFSDTTFGYITLTIVRDGVPTGELPVQSGNIVPGGATYDGSGHYTLTVIASTYYIIGFGTHDASVDNGSDNYTDSLHVFQAAGSTVLLHGTASATVTAVVRPNPVATTALAQQIASQGSVTIYDHLWVKSKDSALYYKVRISDAGGFPALNVDETSGTATPS